MSLSAPSGAIYRIEYAPAFGSPTPWSNLTTVTLSNAPKLIPNSVPTNGPNRVFRGVLVP